MFKAILPSKRIPSSDFTMVTQLGDAPNGKENHRPGKRAATTKGREELQAHQAFDKLLDDLQIPQTVRVKLAGVDSTVKAAMVKSSQTLALSKPPPSPPHTPRASQLRKTRSTETLASPGHRRIQDDDHDPLVPPRPAFLASEVTPRKTSGHSKTLSCDSPGWKSRSQISLTASASVTDLSSLNKPAKPDKNGAIPTKNLSIPKLVESLNGTSSLRIDLELVKRLRLLLRNESAGWTQDFIRQGGYAALLTRLNELLEVEWREEQHDDQVLHELLRCFKALSTSSIGCSALRSSCPTPYVQLVSLLYSDKKPGDVPTRQLIVDLLLILFEIYPSSTLPGLGGGSKSSLHFEALEKDFASSSSSLVRFPPPHKNIFSLIRALLLTPAPPPSECIKTPVSPHGFIESLHISRIYKTYLQELSDICRDYFWVFCHPGNKIWLLDETDETRVEKPRAPGGMTGGVEFEAMGYLTTHIKFINAIAKASADLNLPKENELSAFRLHTDLFLSGFERIILIARKASTTYYPTLHLELARYVAQAKRQGYTLPDNVIATMGLPPNACCKNPISSPRSSPTKRAGGKPLLATPRRMDPIKL